MPTDIGDIRVLISEVGGDVKAILAKLDGQDLRLARTEEQIRDHDLEFERIWSKIHHWTGAVSLFAALFSSGFLYLIYMLFTHH